MIMNEVQKYMDLGAMQKASHDAGWNVNWDFWRVLSPYEKSFFELEFTDLKSLDYYKTRLKALGFDRLGRVLDVACGMGQWSYALAALNNEPAGIDLNSARLMFALDLVNRGHYKNAGFYYSSMEAMPFESDFFDGLFCYGSFMFGDVDKTLAEFDRLLKPGGKVYLNANTTGWYLHLLIDRGFKKRNWRMVKTSLSIILRTLLGKTQNIVIREDWIRKRFERYGFKILACGAEGTVCLNSKVELPAPAYPPSYYGRPSILEFVLQKV